jgi:hypothetical protein
MSSEWDCEWERCKRLAGNDAPTPVGPSGTFKPGTMEGFWEGLFTVSFFPAPRSSLLSYLERYSHHVKLSPSSWEHTPVVLSIVHRIHGIRGDTVRRASADVEQEPRRTAQPDVAPARIPPLAALGPGRVGRRCSSARAPAIQAAVPRGPAARVPPAWADRRARPRRQRQRRHAGVRAGPRGRYILSSVSRAGANHGRICQASSRDPDQGSGEGTSTITSPFLFMG